MSDNRKLRIAQVGCGSRGLGVRLPVIRMMSDVFELAAVCDVDEAKARSVGAEYGVPAYSRVQDLAANEDLDVAAISTPADSHHAVGAYLAERGVSLIVETPISPTLQTADVLLRAVERGGVRLEVAEQFCREPMHLMKRMAIEAGHIGDVLRVFSLFQTGGYHIVSNVRAMACDSEAVRVTGLAMNSPIPRVNVSDIRQYETESWTMDLVEFANGALAVMSYSSMYHGRALGRKSQTLFQVDGTTGTIVEDDVHTTTEAQRLSGGRATVCSIRTQTRELDGMQVLDRMVVETDPPLVWRNPWPQYRTSPRGLAIVEEMDSIARAVLDDLPTRYDGYRARKDIEIELAVAESGRLGGKPVDLPLREPTSRETDLLERFEREYAVDPFDVDACVDVFFPKR
ncbi:MAG: Gfo/Idh/MocA family oxidoreductase [Gemmatimonadetes bacterium]|nr:Gfo/Idh/MocA family oxidoreductase [Gemmatimonadota bacterium]MDE3257093.1 Gfo/Idh/MocA family oxidoreductase [Gemmatimonadota bacterium]